MTNQEKMFNEIRELCLVNGMAIDKIAKETNIPQNLVAKMFLEVMQTIITDMKK